MTALMLTVALTAPPNATPVDAWLADWTGRATVDLTPALVDEWRAIQGMMVRFAPIVLPPEPRTVRRPVSVGVEQWRPLVEEHFEPEHVDDALTVMRCESEGNPDAQHPRSHASGLFQAMPQWYTGRGWSEPSEFGPFDPFDPAENVRFAAWLFYDTGATWGPWVCRP